MNKTLINTIENQLNCTVSSNHAVGGGSINQAYKLQTSNGPIFVKTNNADRFPEMFAKEAKGLELLRNTKAIGVPDVLAIGEATGVSFLVLEWLEPAQQSINYWQKFGCELAELHRNSSPKFGLLHDNYIGSLVQSNIMHDSWPLFFAEQRLLPQAKMAAVQLGNSTMLQIEQLCGKLDTIFPNEPASLLHGDLWSGNYITGNNGQAWIIDPAVYYGNREMDIAMSKLFGGFDPEFYDAYIEDYPMETGWEQRTDICNLYPLLVHVNLFGGGYLGQVKQILSRFV